MSSPQSEASLQSELLRVWRRLLQDDAITLDDDFFEMGGDSLLGVELLAEIESITGRRIPETMLFEAPTVRMAARRLLSPEEIEEKPVVEVTTGGAATPLLFFHGDWSDGGFYVKAFGRALKPIMPLVAVSPHGIGTQEVPATLEEMAQDRLAAILAYRPQGPYRLGGHCAGGMVALETARLLLAQGHEVEFVAMIDPIWTSWGEPWPALAGGETGASAKAGAVRSEKNPEADRRYRQALEKYRPVPVRVPVVIFSSQYDGRPWARVTPNIELFACPGGHFDWVTTRASEFASSLHAYTTRMAVRRFSRWLSHNRMLLSGSTHRAMMNLRGLIAGVARRT